MASRKILITNHSLNQTTGSETYCFNLAERFSKGNDVYIWTPNPGQMSEKMKTFATVLEEPGGEFDYIFYNHNNTQSADFKSDCKIFTIQGIFPKLEQPPAGMDAYVAISEEIAEFHKKLNPVVIRNGVDIDLFNCNSSAEKKKNVLFSSNYRSKFQNTLRMACWSLGLNYRRIGDKNQKLDVLPDLKWADIVVGLGRTALEAMSCGKKVIIADRRSYSDQGMDGFVSQIHVDEICKNNFSGRRYKKDITFSSIRNELKQAIKDTSHWEREYIAEYFNINNVIQKYIELAEGVLQTKGQQ